MRLLDFAPRLMKSLTVIGTIAMFLVGGGILAHGIPWLHLDFAPYSAAVANVPVVDWLLPALLPSLFNMLCGMLAGAATLMVIQGIAKLRSGQ
jgi:predicted DNA repair protein MutK